MSQTPFRSATQSELVGVPQAELSKVWPAIAPMLQRACDRSDGRYAIADVLAALQGREMQLWLAVDADAAGAVEAVCVTELVRYPREKRCGIVFCAGREPQRWLHHLDAIERWARAQGCAALELQGRPGWERLLKGWDRTHVLLRKRI